MLSKTEIKTRQQSIHRRKATVCRREAMAMRESQIWKRASWKISLINQNKRRRSSVGIDTTRDSIVGCQHGRFLVHANHYEELKKNAEATKKFKRLFRGQQCRFKRRSKDIITACSIAAASASDKGVQSVIFGTLKAIAEEMDVKISAKQLSKGTPARKPFEELGSQSSCWVFGGGGASDSS
jgi:hypothetical protein